jgi:hypothetical protein
MHMALSMLIGIEILIEEGRPMDMCLEFSIERSIE